MEITNARKALRKLERKTKKCQQVVEKHCKVQCVLHPTVNLAICNAGLVNGLSEEVIYENFIKYGPLDKIIMLPGISCAFVSYKSKNDAIEAFDKINGKLKLAQDNKPLYLSYTESVPEGFTRPCNQTPPGLFILNDFITEQEEQTLLSLIKISDTADLKHRQVKHYGFEFRYDINNVDKNTPLSENIPEECDFLWERLKNHDIFHCWKPDQLTVNCYKPGQGIPPHTDTHSAFEDPFMSLSLGSTVVMDFRHEDGRHIPVLLPRQSLTIVSGESRYEWTHGITPRTMDVIPSHDEGLTVYKRDTRVSFTFRKVLKGECFCKYATKCDSFLNRQTVNKMDNDIATELEKTHVHNTYDIIAGHFSDTRHTPWPEVYKFVQSLELGSVLVDVGCGNGKYLGHKNNIIEFGCDSSQSLLKICAERGFQVFTCNCLNIPLRSEIADGVISIAVIHHLATKERRLSAINEIMRILRINGRACIYVWAKDQNKDHNKSSYLKQDRKNRKSEREIESINNESLTIRGDVSLPIHINRTQFQHSDVLVPWKLKDHNVQKSAFLRFYHVFEEGELETLCKEAQNVEVIKSYYDQGNWCIILKKIKM